MPALDLWPLPTELPALERLARGRIDAFEDFANRVDGLRLLRLRQADGLGSFLGGRIQLFPHQPYAAERACHSDPVRWLLADEVGLGKTATCRLASEIAQAHGGSLGAVSTPEETRFTFSLAL